MGGSQNGIFFMCSKNCLDLKVKTTALLHAIASCIHPSSLLSPHGKGQYRGGRCRSSAYLFGALLCLHFIACCWSRSVFNDSGDWKKKTYLPFDILWDSLTNVTHLCYSPILQYFSYQYQSTSPCLLLLPLLSVLDDWGGQENGKKCEGGGERNRTMSQPTAFLSLYGCPAHRPLLFLPIFSKRDKNVRQKGYETVEEG